MQAVAGQLLTPLVLEQSGQFGIVGLLDQERGLGASATPRAGSNESWNIRLVTFSSKALNAGQVSLTGHKKPGTGPNPGFYYLFCFVIAYQQDLLQTGNLLLFSAA